MKSFRDRNQVVVGIVAMIVAAAFVTAAFAFGTLGLFRHRYDLSAVFTTTGGIECGMLGQVCILVDHQLQDHRFVARVSRVNHRTGA